MGKLFVVCVDDEAIITESLKRELRRELPRLSVEAALSGEAALQLLEDIVADGGEPAVLVTDEKMPGMRGHELLRQARLRYPRMYGILLTGYSDIEAIALAVNEAGLFRYIHKPWERRDLAMAVDRAAELYEREREVEALHLKVEQLNRALVAALESVAHEYDPESYSHVQRVACYAALLGRTMGLPDESVEKLFMYAPLHDIGKAGIPHDILAKPGDLTREEFAVVKKHVEIGIKLLKSIDVDPFVLDLILYHHERWDGTGYLAEVSGEGIPMSARITALADVLDAMLCKRPYKDALPFNEVAAHIEAEAGTHFDPAVVEAFKSERETFERISSGVASDLCRQFKSCL
jgi:putative two-component system response regulator